MLWNINVNTDKKLCYCRGTARRTTSVEIWSFVDWAIENRNYSL